MNSLITEVGGMASISLVLSSVMNERNFLSLRLSAYAGEEGAILLNSGAG